MRQLKELYGFVVSSKVRIAVLRALARTSPMFQSEIAREIGRRPQNIAREVRSLERAELVECLTPAKQSHKPYVITRLGSETLAFRP